MENLAQELSDASVRRAFLGKWWKRLRFLFRLSVVGYVLGLGLLWLAYRYVGEKNITLAFLLYLPPGIWAIPLVPLLFLALFIDWKSLFVGLLGGALAMYGLMGWSYNAERVQPQGGDMLTVFTFNRGQSQGTSQRPFIEKTSPDLMTFQDARGRSGKYMQAAGYEAYTHGDHLDEYTLVSRFPVTSKSIISSDGAGVAARFTIDWNGREVAVYSVHLSTPREALNSMRRGGFLWGVLGIPGTPMAKKRAWYEVFWHQQIKAAEAILESCQKETVPYLVVGDFNAPSQGYIHQLFARRLKDAHAEAGQWGGYTFPGKTSNPAAFRSPWLRIDKIFCSHDWEVEWSMVEPEQPSQHRAMAATLRLR